MSRYYLSDPDMHCQINRKMVLWPLMPLSIVSGRVKRILGKLSDFSGSTFPTQHIARLRSSPHAHMDELAGECTAAGEMLTGQVV